MKKYNKISLCFDMAGCPNECLHCWIKDGNHGFVTEKEVRDYVDAFQGIAEELSVYTWYLEPDYLPNYKELWELEQTLSTKPHEHYELISDWRILRDPDYVKWLNEVGVKKCQLTFFGLEEKTNHFTGRQNAFSELVDTLEVLIENNISPRIQIFIYNSNIDEIQDLLNFLDSLNIKKKCNEKGLTFEYFSHTGSCVGKAMKLYDQWLTEDHIEKIPKALIHASLEHFNVKAVDEVYGISEKSLYEKLILDENSRTLEIHDIIFYIDGHLDVYPHFAVHQPWWKIGNLKTMKPEEIVEHYIHGQTFAQQLIRFTPIKEMVLKFGQVESNKVFLEEDYLDFITEKYLEYSYEKGR
ncbi:MAG: radical SAM protein [Clostridia bacterium]|nr:radical SAM protein [Clostridia bacterium]